MYFHIIVIFIFFLLEMNRFFSQCLCSLVCMLTHAQCICTSKTRRTKSYSNLIIILYTIFILCATLLIRVSIIIVIKCKATSATKWHNKKTQCSNTNNFVNNDVILQKMQSETGLQVGNIYSAIAYSNF